jgi:TolA-binding protein
MNQTRWTTGSLALVMALALPGCVTIWKYRDDTAALNQRLRVLEEQKAALEARQGQDRAQMQAVRAELVEATEALQKGGANLGADVDALKQDVARLKGADEEQAWAVSKVQEDVQGVKKTLEGLGTPVVQMPEGLGEDREALLKAAREAVEKGDGPLARGILRKFLETYPDEPRAGEAQWLVGETFFKEGKWGQAVKEFQRVHDRYKDAKGAPVGKALQRIAECLLKQGDCGKAAGVYGYLADLLKKGPEADQARAQLKRLKKSCKGVK